MDIVFILVPLTLLLGVVAILAFYWALKRGQFDDMETPAVRILFDEVEADSVACTSSSSSESLE